ncbi:uncharacterized protein jus [Anabrus simplex]|uniref:uncharacterized protein jus n=1 Tax=Anabrus simplex TaxID=316456 RepID=UPI0035A38D65
MVVAASITADLIGTGGTSMVQLETVIAHDYERGLRARSGSVSSGGWQNWWLWKGVPQALMRVLLEYFQVTGGYSGLLGWTQLEGASGEAVSVAGFSLAVRGQRVLAAMLSSSVELTRVNLGEACKETEQCATIGAVCLGTCQCGAEAPAYNKVDNKCDKVAKLKENCTFDEQCEMGTEMTQCVDKVCVCRYEMETLISQDGSLICSAFGNIKLNQPCTVNTDCGTNGAICENAVCKCHEDLPVTDNDNKCGKKRSVNQSCSFDEQCTLTKHTECADGLCKCKNGLVPYRKDGILQCLERGKAKYGDPCNDTLTCSFEGSLCTGIASRMTCQCDPEMPATNSLDKCGKNAKVNESCTFNEQCEAEAEMTECRENRCQCLFQMVAIIDRDGNTKCSSVPVEPRSESHVDPAMIGVLVGMALMFIILCVVLRLFSKARWRENRTIFNTPNPRLMNVSLLRDSKLLHSAGERRGSRASMRAPSRQPSMASLRPQSPSQSVGSRRSRGSSSPSVTSTKSPKSPTKPAANNIAHNTGAPVLENVTVEVQDPKV